MKTNLIRALASMAVVLFAFFCLGFEAEAKTPLKAPGRIKIKKIRVIRSFDLDTADAAAPPTETMVATPAWDPVEGAVGYKVYWGFVSWEESPYEFSGDSEGKTTFDLVLKRGYTYFIAVTAYDNSMESPFSDEFVYTAPVNQDPNNFVSYLGLGKGIEGDRIINPETVFSQGTRVFARVALENFNFPHRILFEVADDAGNPVPETGSETNFRYPENDENVWPISQFIPFAEGLILPPGLYEARFYVFAGGKKIPLEPLPFEVVEGTIIEAPFNDTFSAGLRPEIILDSKQDGVRLEHVLSGGVDDSPAIKIIGLAGGNPEEVRLILKNYRVDNSTLTVSGVYAIKTEGGTVVVAAERKGTPIVQQFFAVPSGKFSLIHFSFPAEKIKGIPVSEIELTARLGAFTGEAIVDDLEIDEFDQINLPEKFNFNERVSPFHLVARMMTRMPPEAELSWEKSRGVKNSPCLRISNRTLRAEASHVRLEAVGFDISPESAVQGALHLRGSVQGKSKSPVIFSMSRTDTGEVFFSEKVRLTESGGTVFFGFESPEVKIPPENIKFTLDIGLYVGDVFMDSIIFHEQSLEFLPNK